MWLKLIGSILIIFSAAYIGFSAAERYKARPHYIRQMICCITALKSYINYKVMPLPEALKVCCRGVDGPVAMLFCNMSEILEQNGWMMPQEALEIALLKNKDRLVLENNEYEVLLLFGSNLGQVNLKEQKQFFDLIEHQLEEIEQEAVKERDQNVKMYRYLGVCGGLALVIILV